MIGIIGLGYVGLPLGLQFARKGAKVLGFDIDQKKVDQILAGNSYIHHIPSEEIVKQVSERMLDASSDFSRVAECEAIIICVPTPLNKNREPDISYVLNTGRAIAPFIGRSAETGSIVKNKLIILESTTYPGTTDDDLRKVLEEGSGLRAGKDFHLAFSPEREDPGNPESQVAKIPKVVGGYTQQCLERATELYRRAIDRVVPVTSCRAAEATKLLENIFRGVNIALVNELKIVYDKMGIDIWEVIEAARTKPFGYMAFYPGPGLGGHCIPIDPFYLTWKAREYGQSTRFIELAGEINTAMPDWVVKVCYERLNRYRKSMRGSKILLLGIAYKANVDDMRESPSLVLMDKLDELGADVDFYDPYIPVVPMTREHPQWAGKKSVPWNRETIQTYDLCLISTAHQNVDYQQLADWSSIIVDTRNAMKNISCEIEKIVKA